MMERHGRIVNITRVVGATGNPGQANYAAAKAGIIGMSKVPGSSRHPRHHGQLRRAGFIHTPMTDVLTDTQKDAPDAACPMARIGRGEDIAAAVAYLASAEAG